MTTTATVGTVVAEAGPKHRLAGPTPFAAAFRVPGWLIGAYLGLSLLTVGAIALLRDNAALVDPAVWSRGVAVAISAVFSALIVRSAARGSRRAWLRLRILSAVMVAAIAVIVALPGDFPLWLKLEQGACGLLLLGAAVLINAPRTRALFRKN